MEIIFLLIGVLIGAIALYVALKPKLQTVQKLDEDTLKKNEHLRIELLDLTKEYTDLTARKEEVIANIATLQKQAEEASNAIYEKSYELANEKMSSAAEAMSNRYRELEQAAEKEYLDTLKDCSTSFQQQILAKQTELDLIDKQLADLASKLDAAVAANKRAEELETQQEFYRLQLSQIDIDEIKRLREVLIYLRDSEPLNKVIWKVYYEKPYTDLIGRVVGSGTHTGIYKITNINNKMCYVGQAVKIGR